MEWEREKGVDEDITNIQFKGVKMAIDIRQISLSLTMFFFLKQKKKEKIKGKYVIFHALIKYKNLQKK